MAKVIIAVDHLERAIRVHKILQNTQKTKYKLPKAERPRVVFQETV